MSLYCTATEGWFLVSAIDSVFLIFRDDVEHRVVDSKHRSVDEK